MKSPVCSLCDLAAAPHGRAFDQEGGHPLLRVVGARVGCHHRLTTLVRIVLAAIDLVVERLLAGRDGV